jgi:hypothetical protein
MAGVDLEGWNIKSAYAESADGNIVAGYIENDTWYQPYIAYVTNDTVEQDGFEVLKNQIKDNFRYSPYSHWNSE